MEAMANSLPVIASDIRGNCDLLKGVNGGILFSPISINKIKKSIKYMLDRKKEWTEMGENNRKKIQSYSLDFVIQTMQKIYFE